MTKSETRGNETLASVHLVLQGNRQALENDHDSQNMQSHKETFLTGAWTRQADDYLRSIREAPLSRYEIKTGWEIPAVLEQALNSDLPVELKALVTSNV
jgi:type IV secretory pathway VirB10-like protein